MQPSNNTVPLFTEVGLLIKSRMQRALPLPLSQCQALWFVAQHRSPTMQEVARYFKITAPSATFLVDELVRGNYLSRKPGSADRRTVELKLTQRGKKECKALTRKREKILNDIFESLSAEDRRELNRILKKIITNA